MWVIIGQNLQGICYTKMRGARGRKGCDDGEERGGVKGEQRMNKLEIGKVTFAVSGNNYLEMNRESHKN